ncbi:hypothetical protein PLANPX_2725 [Lacipirellula parvula]|uniref:Uncharacterized protein n=2 Tax=Lacipirellula parvula TaxID=2650471 RepID=A0A5K7XFV5_9BACT|nr:hypothetical protein PLANPX_2725 [Lacipirellula parvula]
MASGLHAQTGRSRQPAAPQLANSPFAAIRSVIAAVGPNGLVDVGVDGDGLTLPMGPNGAEYSTPNRYRLSVKSNWPGMYGYRPVQVKIRAENPAASDHELEFRFVGGDWNLRYNSITARTKFMLRQGEQEASTTLLVPQFQSWYRCSWQLNVDGTRDDDLTLISFDANDLVANRGNNGNDVAAAGVLLSSSQQLAAIENLSQTHSNATVALEMLKPEEMPTDWLAYTSLNVVFVPAAQLQTLIDDHPQQATALLRWVSMGGNLWLVSAGSRWQEVTNVEQLLAAREGRDRPQPNEASPASNESSLPVRWKFAQLDGRALDPDQGALLLTDYEIAEVPVAETPVNPANPAAAAAAAAQAMIQPMIDPKLPKDSAEWFAVRGWGLGTIVAFRRNLHGRSEMDNQEATRVFSQSLLAPRQLWGGRFGSTPDDGNVEFNDWLIPGVGLAPVGSFQILITLFVLAIGPLTYWLLRRAGKLPMLIAIVPAAAFLATCGLFAYGILADGLGARVRGRSVTLLDQHTGASASWGRYSYYAGIAPRSGLSVPVDQAMFPILPNWSPVFGFGGRRSANDREIVWYDRQELTRGWIASRTPTQFHALAARKSSKQLQLRPTSAGMRATNKLEVPIMGIAIHDYDGKFYWCEPLAPDEVRVVQPLEQTEVASRVRRLFTENLPELPAGDDGRQPGSYMGYAISDSIMEARLAAINSPQVAGWGPGRYIAFTERAIELDPGLEEVSEERSFHVVEGSW